MAARYLAITKSSSFQTTYRKRTLGHRVTTGPVTLGVVIIFLIAAMGLMYLVQSNGISTTGYEIRELQTKIDSLKEDNDALRLTAAELKSLKNLEESKNDLDMVSSTQVNYVTGQRNLASAQ